MDIGKELRVIEVEETTVEPVEMEPLEVTDPAEPRQAERGHTKG